MATGIGAAIRRAVGIGGSDVELNQRADSSASEPAALQKASVPQGKGVESVSSEHTPEVDSFDPSKHAQRLLVWLQSDGGAVGEVLSGEIQAAYAELCAELRWAPLNWLRVGRELGRITGPRRYRDVVEGGVRFRRCVYVIPAQGVIVDELERARHPSAPLPRRLDAVEASIAALAAEVGSLASAVRAAGPLLAGRADLTDTARVVNFSDGRA